MNKNSSNSLDRRLAVVISLATLLAPAAALAQNGADTWVGSTSANFSTGGWTGANNPPSSGDSWLFYTNGSAGVALTDDLTAGIICAGITFSSGASAYTIGGNAFNLAGPIINNSSSPQLITDNVILTSNEIANAASGTLTLGGVIDDGGHAYGLTFPGATNITLTTLNTYSGATIVSGGSSYGYLAAGATFGLGNGLVLSGSGAVPNSSITLGLTASGNPAYLTVVPAAGTVMRCASLIVNATSLGGFNNLNQLTVTGSSAGNTLDDFGDLILNAGELRGSLDWNAAGNMQIIFNSITRNPGTQLQFERNASDACCDTPINIGCSPISSQVPGQVNIVINNPPSMIGGGGGAGTTTMSIIPWCFVNNEETLTNAFATYDPVNGLRALSTSTETAALTSAMTSGQNARTIYTDSSANPTISANTSVNALYGSVSTITFGSDSTILNVASGAISCMAAFAIGGGATGQNGILDFGSAEGNIYVANQRNMVINSQITGSGGLTVGFGNTSGNAANLLLSGSNTFTGITTVVGNNPSQVLRLNNGLALQNSTLDYNNSGASISFVAFDQLHVWGAKW